MAKYISWHEQMHIVYVEIKKKKKTILKRHL